MVDANDPIYGIRCDGVTDDAASWNRLLKSLSGSGTTVIFKGTSILSSPIHWRTKVSLQGVGWGNSILKPVDTSGTRYFPAIQATYGSESVTLDDCTFADFEIDGSGLSGNAAVISAKAIWIRFGRRHRYERLFLHDTIATALGSDFVPDSHIRECRIERAGRNWTGHEGGHAGIGIGMGAWETEQVEIVANTVIDSGHWGIFVEWQIGKPYRSKGARIENNLVTGTWGTGIADVGCTGTYIAGNTVVSSGQLGQRDAWSGIEASYAASETLIERNTISGGRGTGILVGHEPGDGIQVLENIVDSNQMAGISITPRSGSVGRLSVRDNEVKGNDESGIEVRCDLGGAMVGGEVTGNRIWGNGLPAKTRSAAGLLVAGNVSGVLVLSNRMTPSRTSGRQAVALALRGGPLTSVVVAGNHLRGLRERIVVTRGDDKGVRFANNNGYRCHNVGTSIIRVGSRRVRVKHGLDITPRDVDLEPQTFGDQLIVSRIGSRHFEVTRPPGSRRALRFRWTAEG